MVITDMKFTAELKTYTNKHNVVTWDMLPNSRTSNSVT